MQELLRSGVAGQAAALRDGRVGAVELTEAVLAAVAESNPKVNAFSEVLAESALREAAELDKRAAGSRGPLHGVPVAIKQENDIAGSVTTFGGRANHTPAAADGEIVRRLRRAGAVIVGKTTMPEFGLWPFTEAEATGITVNPWDTGHTAGGSSGGSAAAVAAGMVAAAIGGDGGGSLRIPASCCGLFGLKPSRGRVSTAPHPDLWQSLGVLGPLTRSVLDSALVHDAIAGSVAGDRYHAPGPLPSLVDALRKPVGRLRIGWSTAAPVRGTRCDPEVESATAALAATLAGLGHEVRPVQPDYPDTRFAFLAQVAGGVRDEAARVEHYDRLEARTRTVLRLGAWARPAVTGRAIAAGTRAAARVNTVFDEVDLLLTPTLPVVAPPVPALPRGAVRALLAAIPMTAYTAIWNVCGNPAASLPAGFTRSGLPIGVQLVGRLHDEPTLMAVAAQLEQAQGWTGRWPQL